MRVWSCIHRLAGKVVEHFEQRQLVPGLLATPSPATTCLDTSLWSWIFRSVPAGILLLSIKRPTKLSARDSRISDALNNIWFMRFGISAEDRVDPRRSIGLRCAISSISCAEQHPLSRV